MSGTPKRESMVSRRNVLRAGAVGAAAFGLSAGRLILEPSLAQKGFNSPNGLFGAASMAWADSLYDEVYPTSPLILNPFSDPLRVPKALRPVPKSVWSSWAHKPSKNAQSVTPGGQPVGTHQIWLTDIAGVPTTFMQPTALEPIVYK